MAEELQKHQLLVKLLKMTTSAVDAEALVAMRKANQVLADAGWDWDRLMAGKITVVGDPFAGLGDPTPKVERDKDQKRQRYAQAYGATKAAHTQTYAAPALKTLPIASQMPNKFEGHCYCCGRLVAVHGGFIFKPSEFHSRAPDKWAVVCTTDNTNRNTSVGPQAATRQGKGARKVTADDLS